MRFSRKGAKDNRLRLVWSKYYKYVLGDKEFFIKDKAYQTHCDGWIDSQMIQKRTYKNAIKRGNECIEIIVKENVMGKGNLNALALIYSQEHELYESEARGLILKTKEVIEKIRKDSTMSPSVEYLIFKKIMKSHIKQIKGE